MEGRQRVTLYDQMKAGDTSSSRNSLASFLDDVVLTSEISQKRRNQTLLDIIREEEPNNNNTTTKDRKSWKANFKDMLRLKRRNSDESTHQQQQQQQQNDVVREEDTDNSDPTTLLAGGESSDEDNNEQETRQVSMSLMDLLEETEVDLDPISDNDGVDEYQKQEEEAEEEGGEEEPQGCVVESSVEYNCCVCMVRHKGAAFIPCGHTFCRTCSRELWVSRGNCPLCNNFISEILDIF